MSDILESPAGSTIKSGELQGSTTALQLPDIDARYVIFKAPIGNAGNVYLGSSTSMTVADGTTDTTTGFLMEPGDVSPVMTLENLSLLWRRCDNAGDDLTYLIII